jgi:hypothetical protein
VLHACTAGGAHESDKPPRDRHLLLDFVTGKNYGNSMN